MHKFFNMKTPTDLFRKLEREYWRWNADKLNVDYAWDFFVTAEHLPDWIYYQDMPTSGRLRPDLLDGQTPHNFKLDPTRPELRICSHLANGGKHFHLKDRGLTSVSDTELGFGWLPSGWAPSGWAPKALVVELTPDEQRALSFERPSIDALIVAMEVLIFWRRRVL